MSALAMTYEGMNSGTPLRPALEHSVPEQLFSTPDNPVYGVSAVKAIQIAASQGIPIYTITRENADTVIPQLSLDAATIQEIRNAVSAGNEVTVSKGFINFHGWQGCGFIVYNPVNGTGAYMISGQENGGFWNWFLYVFWTLMTILAVTVAIAAAVILLAFFVVYLPAIISATAAAIGSVISTISAIVTQLSLRALVFASTNSIIQSSIVQGAIVGAFAWLDMSAPGSGFLPSTMIEWFVYYELIKYSIIFKIINAMGYLLIVPIYYAFRPVSEYYKKVDYA